MIYKMLVINPGSASTKVSYFENEKNIFTESIFPKAFDTAAQDSYLEAQDTFSSLFEDTSKYKAIMSALAEWLYGEFRKK